MRRSKLETCIDIMEIIAKGVGKPTRIMYKANLSWNPMQALLKHLIKRELIVRKEKGERALYNLTEKGRRVLMYFREAEAEVRL